MADLSGILPALPSGGSWSSKQWYGPNGSDNPNYYLEAFDQNLADQYNQATALAGQGTPYKAGGYLYGYGNPSDPSKSTTNFTDVLDPYFVGGKIIPSQYTMTAAQSVGPAQFQMGGQVTTPGLSTYQTSRPSTATAAVPPSQAQVQALNQPFLFGYNGSKGVLNGTFSNNTPGNPTTFYQSQNPADYPSTPGSLGTFQSLTPQQQALIKSRQNGQ